MSCVIPVGVSDKYRIVSKKMSGPGMNPSSDRGVFETVYLSGQGHCEYCNTALKFLSESVHDE